MKVAIFDFDGTLYKKETYKLMMEHLKNHPIYNDRYKNFLLRMLPSYLGAKIYLYPKKKMRHKAMQHYINTFKDLPEKDILAYFQEIADKFTQDYNEEVLRLLQEHVENKDLVMLVSGAYEQLLIQATKQFSFDYIIGTKIPFKNNRLDLQQPIYHIQGERKTEAIFEALKNKTIDWENSFAYADSFSDLPVFKLVGNPIAVDPDEKLRQYAIENGWKIL